MKKQVHIVHNDYESEPGSVIYGVFSTYEGAQRCKNALESEDNEYGEAQENIEISSYTLL